MIKRMLLVTITLLLLIPVLPSASAQDNASTVDGPVFEIAIHRVVDADNFAARNAAATALVAELDGFVATQEFASFAALPDLEEGEMVAVSMTEWESLDAYLMMADMAEDPVMLEYMETIESVMTIVVQPFVKGEALHVEDLAQPGQVLEMAIRDLSAYDDPVDFLRTIRGFTNQLTELEGVVREYEWISVDGQFFVGMTQYESMAAFGAASANEDLLGSPVTGQVFGVYPPMLTQFTTPNE